MTFRKRAFHNRNFIVTTSELWECFEHFILSRKINKLFIHIQKALSFKLIACLNCSSEACLFSHWFFTFSVSVRLFSRQVACKMLFLALLVAIAVVIVTWYQLRYYRRNQHLNKIPTMKRYPLIGSSLDFIGKSGEQIFKNLENASKELGPIWRLDFNLFRTQIFLSDPKILEGLLSSQKFLTKASEYDVLRAWLGDGV